MQTDTPVHPSADLAIPDAPSMETARLRLMLGGAAVGWVALDALNELVDGTVVIAGRVPSVDDLKRLLVNA
jgi:hypothetical protein